MSIQPKYAEKILAGDKVLELRRTWASSPVDTVVIYASAPEQRIVAIAHVRAVHKGSPTALWALARSKCAGISRRELYAYFKGKALGYGIEFSSVVRGSERIDPKIILRGFRAPQSFSYMATQDFERVLRALAL